MANRWLVVETYGPAGREPTVIAKGRTPLAMRPLASVMGRNQYLSQMRGLIASVAASGTAAKVMSSDGLRQLIAEPLTDFSGNVNGVQAWIGKKGEQPPDKELAGAWYFNLTTHRIGGSDELLDLYRVPMAERKKQKLTAEAFGRLLPHGDQGAALALLARGRPGDEHQATWVVRCDDGEERAVNLACRVVEERRPGGTAEIVVRGITHDIAAAGSSSSEPQTHLLEREIVRAERQPGRARAVVDEQSLTLLRWVDDALPGVAWTGNGRYQPAFHWGDTRLVRRLAADFAGTDRAAGIIRLRTEEGGWMRVHLVASRMPLDAETTGALVILTMLEDGASGG